MESILATRKQEVPSRASKDFCARVDLRLSTPGVESLIKAGVRLARLAPRPPHGPRRRRRARDGQRQQRGRPKAASFFDLLRPGRRSDVGAIARPSRVEAVQRLEFEKEVLGSHLRPPAGPLPAMVESLA